MFDTMSTKTNPRTWCHTVGVLEEDTKQWNNSTQTVTGELLT